MIEAAAIMAFAKRYWWAIAVVMIVLVSAGVTRSCINARAGAASVKSLQRNDAAKDQAAIERRSDDLAISQAEKERQDAIRSAPAGETGLATRALNCQRWMQQHPGATRPAGC